MLNAISIDGTQATLDYDDCVIVTAVSNLKGYMEVELTPDADYADFCRVIQAACQRFTLGFEAANDYISEDVEDYPCDDDGIQVKMSSRMSHHRDFGGDVRNLYDLRLDRDGRDNKERMHCRYPKHATKKSYHHYPRGSYRPWKGLKNQKFCIPEDHLYSCSEMDSEGERMVRLNPEFLDDFIEDNYWVDDED
jgi:hypothetical protein